MIKEYQAGRYACDGPLCSEETARLDTWIQIETRQESEGNWGQLNRRGWTYHFHALGCFGQWAELYRGEDLR